MTASVLGLRGSAATPRWWSIVPRPHRPLALRLALALVCYVPLFWSAPGKVAADTKTYLYLDPGRLLERAVSMWDRNIGMGTVTHQNIGYLFPTGPYYWAMDRLGAPDWIAQRLWLGTILFLAGLGVLHLLRTLGWCRDAAGTGAGIAAFAYVLSPYVLDYAARISVILLPFAGLPWLLSFTIRALRRGGWRDPAWFALVVTAIGGVNLTALVLVGFGPLLWVVHAVAIEREVTWRRALGAALRIGLLTVVASLWWLAGLVVQGRYGIDILRYTETYRTVANTATAPELLRGLGYWFFYGSDKLGPWIEPGRAYTEQFALILVGYALAATALVGAIVTRFRYRSFVVLLALTGIVLAAGAHPLSSPTGYGRLFKAFVLTDRGMSMRSTPRALPLAVLALALLLGAFVAALADRFPARAWQVSVGCALLLALNQPPLFTGGMYGANLQRPESIPAYWTQAASAMDAGDPQTRVLELPGSDFASYRWGNTVDPITPGLMERPYVARELIPYGHPATANLLSALDRRLQEGVFEPAALAGVARLMAVGTVALRSDLQFERYRTPRPKATWLQLQQALGAPSAAFGPAAPNTPVAELPLQDEIALATPAGTADPPEVALFDVPGADQHRIVRAEPAAPGAATVVAGDGEGLVDLAASGLLPEHGVVLYAAAVAHEGTVPAGARLVLTDTNRKAARRWGSVRENVGYTEAPGETALRDDPSDNRLPVFPDETDDDRTVAEQRGGFTRVQATDYGNPVSYTPEERAANAVDGDAFTTWRVGAFADVVGQRLELELRDPVTTDHVVLQQAVVGPRNRWITRARLCFDGRGCRSVALDDASRILGGQTIAFPSRTFRTLSIEILATNLGRKPRYDGASGVGFSEVTIGDTAPRLDEVVRLPVDLLTAAGADAATAALDIVMTRWRANPLEPVRSDPEQTMVRAFTLPAGRTFELTGSARLDAIAADAVVDAAIGQQAVTAVGTGGRMSGDVGSRSSNAIDGDPSTLWQTPFAFALNADAAYDLPAPVTVDHLDLVYVADGRHSVPTELTITADDDAPVVVPVPEVADRSGAIGADALVTARLTLPAPVSGAHLSLRLTGIRPVRTIDYYGESPIDMPVGIAEWGLPGVRSPAPAADRALPGGCRTDLLTVDGAPVAVRIDATVGAALRRDGLPFAACDGPLVLSPGEHVVRTALGRGMGIDVDRIVLRAAATGVVGPGRLNGSSPPATTAITIEHEDRTSYRLRAAGDGRAFWLVLSQSLSTGWHAAIGGRDLGAPTLVDGYANGWLVDPAGVRDLRIELTWTPQRTVRAALAGSAVGLAVCVGIVALGPLLARRRRRSAEPADDPAVDPADEPADDAAVGDRSGGVSADEVGRMRPRFAPGPIPWGRPTRTAIVAGVALGFVAGVPAGLAAATAVVVLHRWPSTWRWWRIGPLVLMGTVWLYVVALSVRWKILSGFDWPSWFEATNDLGWMALALAVTFAFASRAEDAEQVEDAEHAEQP